MLFIKVSEYNLPLLKLFIALCMFLALSIFISNLPVFFVGKLFFKISRMKKEQLNNKIKRKWGGKR